MYAVKEGNTIRMSCHLTSALDGFDGGYTITMHALPGYTFQVQAPTGEAAVQRVIELCKREGKHLSTDAATFQRRTKG